jgi:hypothetical protein
MNINNGLQSHNGNQMFADQQFIRQSQQMQVHQFHRRKGDLQLLSCIYPTEELMYINTHNHETSANTVTWPSTP